MARAGPGRAGSARRGLGERRLPTWEISDSDAEGPAGAETPARGRDPAEERRPAAEALRRLRPGQAVRRLAVLVDPAVLEDAGADTLMEALHALGCEPRAEPQRPARSLRWSRESPDPCPRGVPPEVWAEDEPHMLLLLEPEEFVRGVLQLTQVRGPTCPVPWVTPESPARPHLAVIGLDAYLWSQKPSAQKTQQPEHPAVTRAEVAVGWPEVEEVRQSGGPGAWSLAAVQGTSGLVWPVGACVVGEPCAPHHGHSHLGPGAPAALGKRGCAAGSLLAGAEPARVCLHQGPRPAPLQAGPGVWGLPLLYFWALGGRRASGQRWHGAAAGLVAAGQAVQPRQPGCGRRHCQRLPIPPPAAAGVHGLWHRAGAPGPAGRPPGEDGQGCAAPQGGARPLPPRLPLPDHH
ncbi:probable crossover junction endonuclease EME2 isoform X2 [Bos javanicus]|uniref:probable crossover junction endonuclease EME2 isoform X2 n=1 Tax=Bos javanicus TaxID=9906 RepID=UPI002AA70A73|nr:probable crossover junction endonuclease EME2 isoform X2 [Bos javanicus]